MEAFIDDSYCEYRGWATYARYRKPQFVKQAEGNGDVFSVVVSEHLINFAHGSLMGVLQIPYFDAETEAFLDCPDPKSEHFSMKQRLEEAYLHGREDAEDLHLACTLDQSYYTSLRHPRDRARDQVVYRFDRQAGRPPKILMVNQLWLWKIDKSVSLTFRLEMPTDLIDTIVTALPERWDESEKLDTFYHILRCIWNEPPPSLDQMIFTILQQCLSFVDAPLNSGLNENLFNIFEQSIASVVRTPRKGPGLFLT